MMSRCIKKFVCFARSHKDNGFFIAGKEWPDNGTSSWIRPVSNEANGQIRSWEMGYKSGNTIEVLDIVSAKLIKPALNTCRREDYVLASDNRWQRKGKLTWSDLDPWLDHPISLWEKGYHSIEGQNDIQPVTPGVSTLFLVRVKRLDLMVKPSFCGQIMIRGRFIYKGTTYDMKVTDSWLMEGICYEEPQTYSLFNPVLCVSLDKTKDDHYHKFIAAVLFERRFS